MNKREQIRQAIKIKRSCLTKKARLTANNQIAHRIVTSKIFQNSRKIACYMAMKGEVDLTQVVDAILGSGRQCYLPHVRHDKPGFLHFIEYLKGDVLQAGSFGILEPSLNTAKIIASNNLDLILVPLTAFDKNGNRLGAGGGYYDRTFSFSKNNGKPVLIGVAFECQKVPQIEAYPHDVKLHGVITEKRFYLQDAKAEFIKSKA